MDPITRIRQFIDTHPDCWAADCFRKYLQGAPEGVSLEQAFGLTVGPGRVPWWREESLKARDDAIRRLADQHFGNLDLNSQADEILQTIRRYRRGRWRFDQSKECIPEYYVGTPSGLLYEAFRSGDGDVPESKRHLLRILSAS